MYYKNGENALMPWLQFQQEELTSTEYNELKSAFQKGNFAEFVGFMQSIKDGDVLICFSTSGKSKNVIKAIDVAKSKCVFVVSFIGNDGGEMKNISDISLIIPSNNTARIQECHTLLGHTILEIVENKMFKK